MIAENLMHAERYVVGPVKHTRATYRPGRSARSYGLFKGFGRSLQGTQPSSLYLVLYGRLLYLSGIFSSCACASREIQTVHINQHQHQRQHHSWLRSLRNRRPFTEKVLNSLLSGRRDKKAGCAVQQQYSSITYHSALLSLVPGILPAVYYVKIILEVIGAAQR